MSDNSPVSSNDLSSGGDHIPPSDIAQVAVTEVLTKIISFLPLWDRKNARLVCWNWYRAATHRSISKTEKLVCVSFYDRKQTFNMLYKSINCVPHLQFYGFLFDQRSVGLWKKLGNGIHSLDFVGCRFTDRAARSIIDHCTVLKELSLKKCVGFFTCDVFDRCTKKTIQRCSLESIRIEVDSDINDYIFKQVFEVFPRIKTIAVSVNNDRSYNNLYNDAYFHFSTKSEVPTHESKVIFSHSAVYERLKSSSDVIKHLEYIERDRDVNRIDSAFLDSVRDTPNLKLSSLSFSPSMFNIPKEASVIAFFARQDNLQRVVLEKGQFTSECCSAILDGCPNLRYLELRDSYDVELQNGPIVLSQGVLEKLVNSKLESLKMNFDFRFAESGTAPSIEYNTTLRTLCVNSSSVSGKNISTLMEAFQNLRCLDLAHCNLNDALMQTILKYQVNLETLILSFNKDFSDFGLTGKPLKLEQYMTVEDTFSISRLTRLKILNLRDCAGISARSLKEMVLPELKYLSLQHCKKISFDGFQVIGENCPRLEYLDLSSTAICPESLIKLYRQLDRLYFLDITFCAIDELSMQVILGSSQSLRYVRHTTNQYYFNIFKKQWKPTKIRTQVDVDCDTIKKSYGVNCEVVFPSKLFSCWRM